MGTVNKAILVGNLGRNPELMYTPSGQPVTHLSVATTERWTSGGQKHERTDWHRVTVWGKPAENAAKYLTKGRSVYVEGRITNYQWTDKEGIKRWGTGITATRLVYLGSSTGQNIPNDAIPSLENEQDGLPGEDIP